MRFDIVTLFPELVTAVGESGVTGRAVQQGRLVLETWNPRDWGAGFHQAVDDRPYGGGPGMVMQYGPLASALEAARADATAPLHVIALTPQGRPIRQAMLRELVRKPRVALVCGRYEGIDERFIEAQVDEEWSLGDYVLSGGELGAMVVIDACARLLPVCPADGTGGLVWCSGRFRLLALINRVLPGDQRQRLGHQVQVRQPVRLPRVHRGLHQARHRRDDRGQDRRGRRLW